MDKNLANLVKYHDTERANLREARHQVFEFERRVIKAKKDLDHAVLQLHGLGVGTWIEFRKAVGNTTHAREGWISCSCGRRYREVRRLEVQEQEDSE